jgi:hypothetical protein
VSVSISNTALLSIGSSFVALQFFYRGFLSSHGKVAEVTLRKRPDGILQGDIERMRISTIGD